MTEVFTGNFTWQDPIRSEARAAAMLVLDRGWWHRYTLCLGEIDEAPILNSRLPLTFSLDDCALRARITAQELARRDNKRTILI